MSPSFRSEFHRVYDEWWDRLYTYLDRTTADGDEANDIAQEAFIRLYSRGSMPGDPGAWLVSVANNLLRDRSRKRRRRSRILAEHPTDAAPGEAPEPPDARMERHELRERVRSTLDALPLRQRRILLLRSTGMSYKEIAAAMGMPMTSVGQTLARAMNAFRRSRPGNDARH